MNRRGHGINVVGVVKCMEAEADSRVIVSASTQDLMSA
jgi:hypothetical protein